MKKKFKSNHDKFKKSNSSIYSQFEKSMKKTSPVEKENYLETLSSQLKLPADILAGAPIVTATGRNQIYVENYKGIIEYTGKVIKIQTKLCKVCIEGSNLNIDYYTNDEMQISGIINTISYR
ncbi:sporulation protein YqfC [Mobilisporobacter senegalensis]|uniref:Sporulation protein YqfC n=1 Tax=Mobilisporobacter senegalensis TaxID=1329262 RepID=A0A3N1XWL5_9FIRM|nr:YabP/YqfC family sporulation protein [Mobilisporobacter senegalensis]ROR29327.1 sporulation protein YqfC [Mobilisporobacter senegalensis]